MDQPRRDTPDPERSDDDQQQQQQPPPTPPPYARSASGEELTLISPPAGTPPAQPPLNDADMTMAVPAGTKPAAPAGGRPSGYPNFPGTPPQGYPPYQGTPPQGYPPYQGTPPQGYPPHQGTPPQGYPPAQPPQGYPPQPNTPPSGYGVTQATMPANWSPDTQATVPQGNFGQTPVTGAGGGTISGSEPVLEGTVLADYLIEKKIGQGGMGAVYQGRQLSLDRPVAIKVLPAHLSKDASFIERFQLEARAVAKLTHQNIIQVYGAGEAGGMHYFAMEFVQGKDLSQRMKEGYRPTCDEAVNLMLQAARGLAEAGRQRIVHRDIKPHNMMVTDDALLKIMDFGLVKITDDTHALTMTGAVMGTVTYFSPEQGRGERCDCRTDLYALGITFYELLTGTVPFSGNDASSIIYQHIHSEPRPLLEINPDIPEDIQAVVMKCLEKKREDRYQTADELLQDLESIKAGREPVLVTRRHRHKQKPTGSGSPLTMILVLLLLTAIGAGAWYVTLGPGAQSMGGYGGGAAGQLQQARGALAVGDIDRAQLLIEQGMSQGNGGAAWDELLKELQQKRGRALAGQIRNAIKQNRYDDAEQILNELTLRNPGGSLLQDLRDELAAAQGVQSRLADVRTRLNAGKAEEAAGLCRQILDNGAASAQTDAQNLLKTAQTMAAAHNNADTTLAKGDYDTANRLYQQSLQDWSNDIARLGVQLVPMAKSFDQAITERRLNAARNQVAEMQALLPQSHTVTQAVARVAELDLFLQAAQQLDQLAMADADALVDQLRQRNPESRFLPELEQMQRQQHALLQLRGHIDRGDLVAAKTQVQAIAAMAPGSKVLERAKQMLAASQLEQQKAAQAQQAREQSIQAAFSQLNQSITQGQITVQQARQQLQALQEQHGQRSEIGPTEQLIQGLAAEQEIRQLLHEIDAAVTAKQLERVQARIKDEKLLSSFELLSQQAGLVFKHQLRAVQRQGHQATADIVLHQGFEAFPESDLSGRYELVRQDDGWLVRSAQFETP
jgi:predicted Ser/Thr protein kinase